MASFFQKLHGTSSSVPLPPKIKQTSSGHRTKTATTTASVEKITYTTITQSHADGLTTRKSNGDQVIINKAFSKHNTPVRAVEHVVLQRAKSVDISLMQRTSSSSSTASLPAPKRRKLVHLRLPKDTIARLGTLAPSAAESKRRRTASPAHRIHRSTSDDETDFSEHIKLFRDETPDIVHHPPVSRRMLNLRAGEDVIFMHAKELVSVIDKDSFLPEDLDNPALDITLQLPFAEEMYTIS